MVELNLKEGDQEGEASAYCGEVGTYDGEAGAYCGEAGTYDGEAGAYDGEADVVCWASWNLTLMGHLCRGSSLSCDSALMASSLEE